MTIDPKKVFPRYFALEGIDGSGKTTVAKKVAEILRAMRVDVVLLREPAGMLRKEAIDALLNGSDEEALGTMIAARALTMIDVEASHSCGAVVLQDRSFWSSAAYQGGDDFERILRLHVGWCPWPKKTFLLNVYTGTSGKRILSRGPDPRPLNACKLRKTRRVYVVMATLFSEWIEIIDAEMEVEDVALRTAAGILDEIGHPEEEIDQAVVRSLSKTMQSPRQTSVASPPRPPE